MNAPEQTSKEVQVVYVHGVGNKPPPDVLKRDWDKNLFRQDLGNRSKMAYWADLRHKEPLKARLDPESAEAVGAAMFGGRASPVGEPTLQISESALKELSPQGREFGRAVSERFRTYAGPVDEKPEIGIEVVPGPSWLGRWLLRQLLEQFVRDADAYFFKGQKKEIQDRLRDKLRELTAPAIVVGHSLGSVIAYEVLNDPAFASLDIRLFITIGSPLGVEEVQQEVKPLRVPQCAPSWHNFADRWDLVALDPTLREEFQPKGTVVDAFVNNPAFNNHSAPGYLSAQQVRAAVGKGIG